MTWHAMDEADFREKVARMRARPDRWAVRAKAYGVTRDYLLRLYDEQDGCCAICGLDFKGEFAVDHDHKTGKVRGLLCDHCNRGLGSFKDNIARLARACEYVRSNNERRSPAALLEQLQA